MNTEMVTVVPTTSDGHPHQRNQQLEEHLDSRYRALNTSLPRISLADPRHRDYNPQEDRVYPTNPEEGPPAPPAPSANTHLVDTTGGGGSNLDLVISQTLLAGVEINSQSHQCTLGQTSACRGGSQKLTRDSGLVSPQTMTIAQYEDPIHSGGSYGNLQNHLENIPPVAGYYEVNSDGVAMDNNEGYSHNLQNPPSESWDQASHAANRQDLYDIYDGYESNIPRHFDHQDQFFHHHHLGFHHHHHLHNHIHQNFHEFSDDHGFLFAAHHNGYGSQSNGSGNKPKRRRVPTLAQRRAANIRERRRMYNLNEAFDELRTKVPTFAYEKRLSRIETLRLAMTYISFMSEIVRDKVDKDLIKSSDKGISGECEIKDDTEGGEEMSGKVESEEVSEVTNEDVMSEPASRNT